MFGFFSELKKECLTQLHSEHGVSCKTAHGRPRARMPICLPGSLPQPPISISFCLPLTMYHKTICMPRTPKYFCMRGSLHSPLDCWKSAIPLKASEVPGHHESAPPSRVTPALCLSGWVEACCAITGTVEDPWRTPLTKW